ncbi:MAG: hypothetical protein VR74_19155 [Hyphomonas sp. BRH_c22]|nr:DUF885 domain-containing protein [Hyphomonas sp. BRH_c22]KJS34700.1 MAG: hypothetical protein VR74_19155 [Hyphomonas sp. BRH_c22]
MKIHGLMMAASLVALAATGCTNEPAGQAPDAFIELPAQPEETPPIPQQANADPMAIDTSTEWGAFLSAFLDGYFPLNPDFAVYQGRHEFDGQLPDWSPEGLKAARDQRTQAISTALALDPAGLTPGQAFERDYLVAVLQGELFWIEKADWPHRNPDYYVGALDPNVYIARPYADAETRMKAFIAYAKNVPAAAAQIEANLKLPLPETYLKYGQAGFSGFAEYYAGDAKAAFADVTDQALQAEFDTAAAAAAAAMQHLSDHIGSVPATMDGYALGAETFSGMVRLTEGVDVPLAELKAIGEADLARNQEALKGACGKYAPELSLGDCMKKMGANKPEIGPVEEAREQLPALRAFLVENDIVSIPGTEQALVEESPPYNRQNSAYIDIPGPYETGLPSVYYISPPDPSWDAETRAAYIPGKMDLLGTSVHEVWPGHFLNFLHSNRSDSVLGKLFVGYAFAEGWAHYTEEMMYEAGLHDGDPETHIGQLSNALLRNCRYLSAISLHAEGMTVQESYDLFRNECYQDAGNATQQAARGTYDPAYLNYTMGKLMIRKLRNDWTAKHYPDNPRAGWKAFHDEFLSYGGPPIPLVRKEMMDEDAPRAVF